MQLQNVETKWAEWKQNYMDSHPYFNEALNASTAKVDRAKIVDDLKAALASPGLPNTPQAGLIRTLVSSFETFQAAQAKYTGMHSYQGNQAKSKLEGGFATWAKSFADAHPEIAGLYQRIILPEVGGKVATAQTQSNSVAQSTQVATDMAGSLVGG
jgi:hypothetical protein